MNVSKYMSKEVSFCAVNFHYFARQKLRKILGNLCFCWCKRSFPAKIGHISEIKKLQNKKVTGVKRYTGAFFFKISKVYTQFSSNSLTYTPSFISSRTDVKP